MIFILNKSLLPFFISKKKYIYIYTYTIVTFSHMYMLLYMFFFFFYRINNFLIFGVNSIFYGCYFLFFFLPGSQKKKIGDILSFHPVKKKYIYNKKNHFFLFKVNTTYMRYLFIFFF